MRRAFHAVAAAFVAVVCAWGAVDLGRTAGRVLEARDISVLGLTECRADGAYMWVRPGLPRQAALEVITHEGIHAAQCAELGAGMWIWTNLSAAGSIDLEIEAFAETHLRHGHRAAACPWVVAERIFDAYPRAQSVWPGWVMRRAFAHCGRPF